MTAPRTPNRRDPPSHTPRRRSSPGSRPRALPARPAAVRHAATPLGVRPPELIPLDPTTEREVVTLLARLLVDWLNQHQRNAEPTPPRAG
jgi:hypothetical protein